MSQQPPATPSPEIGQRITFQPVREAGASAAAQPAPQPGAPGQGGPSAVPHSPPPRPPARPARIRGRHRVLAFSFLVVVLLPVMLWGAYLWGRAGDQYASSVGFAVRAEESTSPVEFLGGLTQLSGGNVSGDSDILYEYIQSQQIIEAIDQKLDLRRIYSRGRDQDFFFTFPADGTLEDLVDHWGRMVRISYDSAVGLLELRVLAFTPQDAQAVAQAIFEQSSLLINDLSATARADATRFAREELERAVERLKNARQALTTFRSRTQIIDPEADVQVQMGLLNTLQTQLAEALIQDDLLRETTREGDPRLGQAQRRIEVIRRRIEEERGKFSVDGETSQDQDYVAILGEFERLSVDAQFAEQSYLSAQAAYDHAQAEARRNSRYLAAYIRPTLAQSAQFPNRPVLLGLAALFLFLSWAMAMLVYYAIRDRR